MEVKPISWSHSRLKTFETCPKKFWHMNVKKDVPFDETPETIEGKRLHKALENRVRNGTPLEERDQHLEPVAQVILRTPGQTFVELAWALSNKLTPCGYKDWTNAWVRAIADVLKINGSVAWAGDYKTGKPRVDEDQLMLTAAVVFAHYPDVETVVTSYIWLKTGTMDTRTYTRKDIMKIWSHLLPKVGELQKAHKLDSWKATPGPLCGWCEVNKLGKCDKASTRPKT